MKMRVRKHGKRIEVRLIDFPNLKANDLLVVDGQLVAVSLEVTWQYHAELAAKMYVENGVSRPSSLVFDLVEMPESLVAALNGLKGVQA
jgi:hypothetical protein